MIDPEAYAFPLVETDSCLGQPGMTILDWFAGQALAGVIADHHWSVDPELVARAAYGMAEALLAEKLRREED